MIGRVVIKEGREKPILNQHPWIFSGAIAKASDAEPGELVTVVAHDNSFLARGYWNPQSQIQVRILTWHDEPIEDGWWKGMLRRAIEARTFYNWRQRNMRMPFGYRLINAENDFIPGLIVDRYGDFLVLQALTLYIDKHKATFARWLNEIMHDLKMPIRGVYERSDVDVRRKEGLEMESGFLWGVEPPELVEMSNETCLRLVDIRNGHKTGYYLDQLGNQEAMSGFLVRHNLMNASASMLNLFSYTGGFGLAMVGKVVNVDSSREVLELGEEIYTRNGWTSDRVEFIQADVFDLLHAYTYERRQFDIVILDPPKFAHNKQQVEAASRGYKDLNMHALRAVKPGSFLFTFSCSGAIGPDLFQKIVFGALADVKRQAQIVKNLGPGDDHPTALTFPEGEYLKGLLLRVY